MPKIKNRYTKYVDLCYDDDNEIINPFLCGEMPISERDVWRDTHLDDIQDKFSHDEYVPVYSFQRGWRWNRHRILTYLKEIDRVEGDINFILYHEDDLRKVLGNKHFRDMLRELGLEAEYKREKPHYYKPGHIVRIVDRVRRPRARKDGDCNG